MIQKNSVMLEGKRGGGGLFASGSLFRIGALLWLVVVVLGYMEFRIAGEDLYDSGQTVPAMLPKGVDFRAVYNYGIALESGLEDYLKIPNVYPPFVTVALLPLTVLPPHLAYEIFALLIAVSLFTMAYVCLIEHGQQLDRKNISILSLAIAALLLQTYPVNFALERGNNDTIAAAFAALALFSLSRNAWIRTIIFLTISIQFKIYFALLAIFLLRFEKKAIYYFVMLNILMLLMLGATGFEQFLRNVNNFSNGPFVWAGNHSLFSFITNIGQTWSFDSTTIRKLGRFLYLPFMAGFFLVSFRFYRETSRKKSQGANMVGFNSREIGLIGLSFCLMSLVFSTSHDYKLVIHFVPFLLLLTRNWQELFITKKEGYIVTGIISVAVAFLFIPRFNVFPQEWFTIAGVGSEMKTPGIIIAYMGYLFLALKDGGASPESSQTKLVNADA